MSNKMLGFLATALMALVGTVPASTQAGDIWSIEQFSDAETASRTFPNADQPLVAGEKLKFRIRLVNRDQQPPAASVANPWTLQYVGPNEPSADTNKMPRVGLWISGQCRFADVESWSLADKYFTDVICSYTVQPGDLARPLRLANSSGTGPAMGGTSSEPYYVENLTNPQLWNFFPQNDNGQKLDANKVDLTFMSLSTVTSKGWTWLMTYAASRTYDLAADKAIYIQAVDFDDQYVDDEKTVWRNIGAGTTSSSPEQPCLSIPGGCAESQDLYVWTKDPTIAEMANGTETEYVFRDGKTRKVSRVSIKAGDTTVSFKIKGILKGMSTEVYMAATPTNVYNAAGTLVKNFTTRTIAVIEPPPPSLSVVITPNDVTTSSDYRTPAATVMVELSQAWNQDLSVNVKMSTKDGTSAWKYIGLSDKGEGDTEYGNQIVTLKVPAGFTSSASGTMLYLYANRADDNTLKGIKFEIDETSLSPAAKAYFTGNPVSATVLLRSCTPQISAPAENDEYYNIPCNVMTDFRITVADAKGELDDGTYTVCRDNDGTGTYDQITGLKANARGEIVVPRTYTAGKTYNSRFYVVNEGGAKSEIRTVKVQVNAPKVVTVTTENGSNTAKEGDRLTLNVNFSEYFDGGDASGIGYVWLIPADVTTSNLVESTAINVAGSKIYLEATKAADMELKLKDGYTGCKLTFTPEVHYMDNLKPASLDSSWIGQPFTITVTNVMPQVRQVIMNNTPMSTDGGTFAANVPATVANTFRVNATDPGEIDATNKNFVTEFKFWENGRVVDTVTFKGAMTDASATHAFGAVGTNKVTVRVRDKDMTDQEWANAKVFTAYVNTVEPPAISVSAHNGSSIFKESDIGPSKGRIDVNLTAPPTGLGSSNITVVVEITRNRADNGNYPLPSVNGTPTRTADKVTTEIKFKNGQTSSYFYFNGLDGTSDTEARGFHIRAYVKEETVCPADPTKTWREYYQESDDFVFFVVNESPVIGPGSATTNEIHVTIGVPFKIAWNVSDVLADQTNKLQITWTYGGGMETETVDASKGTFYKQIVLNSTGCKTVGLMVTDKDGGGDLRTFYYKVIAHMSTQTVDGIEWTYRAYSDRVYLGGDDEDYPAVSWMDAKGVIAIPTALGGYPVTGIGYYAFKDCRDLTSLTIPSSVEWIDDLAFCGCSNLTNVVFTGNAPVVGGMVFHSVPTNCMVKVYPGTTGWDDDGDGKWNGMTIVYRETHTSNTDVAVPYAWMRTYFPKMEDSTEAYAAAAKKLAANGHNTVEQAYVAGLNPADPASEFKSTVVCSNGLVYVGWTPDLNSNSVQRIYTLQGRTDLGKGDWETPVQPWHRFFRVEVSFPKGGAGEETAVANEGLVPQANPAGAGQP